ncbi:MAG: hypothetical protein KA116_11650 [Proteobacteria bacterium]|nr:hypothetical protein [Pseudomonadota bacterium]
MKSKFKFGLAISSLIMIPLSMANYTQQPAYMGQVSAGAYVQGYDNGMRYMDPSGQGRMPTLGEGQGDDCYVLRGADTVVRNQGDMPMQPGMMRPGMPQH